MISIFLYSQPRIKQMFNARVQVQVLVWHGRADAAHPGADAVPADAADARGAAAARRARSAPGANRARPRRTPSRLRRPGGAPDISFYSTTVLLHSWRSQACWRPSVGNNVAALGRSPMRAAHRVQRDVSLVALHKSRHTLLGQPWVCQFVL